MKDKIYKIFIAIVLLGAIGSAIYFAFGDKQIILAKVTHKHIGDMLVIGDYTNIIDGWNIAFCWRRNKGPWMEYYLAHKSKIWRNVEISISNNAVIIRKNKQIVGQLNMNDASFIYPQQSILIHKPMAIVLNDDPFNSSKRIYPESPGWEAVWPSARNGKWHGVLNGVGPEAPG